MLRKKRKEFLIKNVKKGKKKEQMLKAVKYKALLKRLCGSCH